MKDWTPEEIRELRERHNLSQIALGRLLGVSGNYIYLLEKGVRNPGKSLKLLLSYIEKQLSKKRRESERRHGKGKRHI